MSLVLRYRFDEPTASLTTDSSGNSNTLVNGGGVVSASDATYGDVASFDGGSTSQFTIATPPSTITGSSPRTLSFWLKRNITGTMDVFGQDTGSVQYTLRTTSTYLRVYFDDALWQMSNPLVDGAWYHFALTSDGTTQIAYYNGSQSGTRASSFSIGTGPLIIGGAPVTSPSFQLDGCMSDFRMYDGVLSSTEINNMYTAGPNPVVVNWVLDANGMYEVSSKRHLIQIMNDGAIYTNTGDVPTPNNGQWGGGNWIQTADIDLEGDSTDIRSLGYTSNWVGEYDGNGYTISNWAFVESSFPSASTDNAFGLFGIINGGTVKNVRLAGVCTLSGFKDGGGMISSRVIGNCVISNIEVDLSPGSYITQSNSETIDAHMGCVFGRLDHGGTVTGVTFKGVMDSMTPSTNASANVGGIVGYMRFCVGTNTLFRNLGTFPSGLSGTRVGGIAGYIHIDSNLNKVLNAMTGDLSGTSHVGGVYGFMSSPENCYEFINSMKGNITAVGSNAYLGGIGGNASGSAMHSLMNYMTGNIINTNNAGRAGGLIGQGASTTDIATSINAMNGTVYESILASTATSLTVATVNISFGLEFTSSNHSTTDPVTGLPTDPETGLPVVDLSATDPDGVTYTFEFVFGNGPRAFNQLQIKSLGDNFNMNELEIYTLLGENIALVGTASTDSPSPFSNESRGNDGITDSDSAFTIDLALAGGPTWTLDLDRDYTLSEINKVVFYNRITFRDRAVGAIVTFHSADGLDPEQVGVLTTDLIQEFVITDVPLTVIPRALNVKITVSPVAGATAYRLTLQRTGSTTERVAKSSFTDLDQTIPNLTPEIEYTFRLYSTNGNGYTLVGESTVTTLANSASNYDANDFLGASGTFDLSSLDTTSVGFIADIMNDLFTTGDSIDINVPGGRGGTTKSKFVNRGANVSIENSEALVAPFSTDAGAGQSVSLTLSDSSVVALSYDETTEAITVGLTSYTSGDSFVLDGKKATILDI